MAFCRNCGKQLEEGTQFCPACGTATNEQPQQAQQPQQVYQQAQPQQPYQQAQPQQAYQQAQPQQAYQQGYQAPPVDDVTANRGIAWLAYLGPLLLIPMFARKFSRYCQFHVRQGFPLGVIHTAYGITFSIILAIASACSTSDHYDYYRGYVEGDSTVFTIFLVLFWLGNIFFTVFEVIGIVNAATGKQNKLPVFGAIRWFEGILDKIYGVR